MMSKRKLYEDRILLRLSRHNARSAITASLWPTFENENEDAAKHIKDSIEDDGEPLLAYWHDKNCWTALTAEKLFSVIDGEMTVILLDEIHRQFDAEWTASTKDKRDLEFLFVGPDKRRVWAPAGPKYFALWNVLLMFPLNVPKELRGD